MNVICWRHLETKVSVLGPDSDELLGYLVDVVCCIAMVNVLAMLAMMIAVNERVPSLLVCLSRLHNHHFRHLVDGLRTECHGCI